MCWRACNVQETKSVLHLYRIHRTGVVSVGEMSHKVRLKLQRKKGKGEEETKLENVNSDKSENGKKQNDHVMTDSGSFPLDDLETSHSEVLQILDSFSRFYELSD